MFNYNSRDYINPNEKISILKYVCDEREEIHTHDFIEIEYIFQGFGHQQINASTYPVEAGDLLFLNFRDSHSIRPSKNLGIINVIFNPDFFSNELVNSENALDILALTSFKDFDISVEKTFPKMGFSGNERKELESVMDLMKTEFDKKLPGYMTALKSYTNVLLVKIFRSARLANGSHVYIDIKKIAPEVLRFIEENYNRKLTLTELAKQSFYNPTYFSKVFKECYGKSVTEYINNLRIDSAISLIRTTDDTIDCICHEVGFNDRKQFFKLFKANTSMTPEVYRNWTRRNPTQT